MKKVLFIAVLLLSGVILAQDFQGIATYKSHRKLDDFKVDGDGPQNDALQKQIEEQLKKQFQREYTLKFTKEASMYQQVEKLSAPQPQTSGINITIDESSNLLFKNIKEKRYSNQTDIMGKQFLIKDELQPRDWVLGKEKKFIGEYECYKATYEDEYTMQTVNDGEITEVKKKRLVTAWYTPQIPISNGPAEYEGLPGLILEINDGQLTLICSKIVINPKEAIDLKEPTKGKVVTEEKFSEIMEKKNKEMMERMRGRNRDGEQRVMIIGN
ncbi:GLPGLI family protein [Pseudofulvibacter geojedonensis]|uniref:GLPGLI family protein n=1 Tax=Pseudofulvibacter geojedonensis TaxID=1123758 RepID=A0ABW3I5V2_9FLAO